MNETRITVHGNVVNEPVARTDRNGHVYTTFRVGTTPYRRTPEGKYLDLDTTFYGVIAFNTLGANTAGSLRKGQPVIVEGNVSQKQYVNSDGEPRQSLEIEASRIGHDLTFGRASFERVSKAVALGYDRTAEPDIRNHMIAMNDGDERRPDNVDADGVLHDELVPVEVGAIGGLVGLSDDDAPSYGDPATDPYELEQPAA